MDAVAARYRERPGRHPAVAAVWCSATEAPGATVVAADGCFDLIVRTRDGSDVSAFVYTPVARAHDAVVAAGDRHLGVRLRPGFGAALVDHPELIRIAERDAAECPEAREALVVSALEARAHTPDSVAELVA